VALGELLIVDPARCVGEGETLGDGEGERERGEEADRVPEAVEERDSLGDFDMDGEGKDEGDKKIVRLLVREEVKLCKVGLAVAVPPPATPPPLPSKEVLGDTEALGETLPEREAEGEAVPLKDTRPERDWEKEPVSLGDTRPERDWENEPVSLSDTRPERDWENEPVALRLNSVVRETEIEVVLEDEDEEQAEARGEPVSWMGEEEREREGELDSEGVCVDFNLVRVGEPVRLGERDEEGLMVWVEHSVPNLVGVDWAMKDGVVEKKVSEAEVENVRGRMEAVERKLRDTSEDGEKKGDKEGAKGVDVEALPPMSCMEGEGVGVGSTAVRDVEREGDTEGAWVIDTLRLKLPEGVAVALKLALRVSPGVREEERERGEREEKGVVVGVLLVDRVTLGDFVRDTEVERLGERVDDRLGEGVGLKVSVREEEAVGEEERVGEREVEGERVTDRDTVGERVTLTLTLEVRDEEEEPVPQRDAEEVRDKVGEEDGQREGELETEVVGEAEEERDGDGLLEMERVG